MSNSAFAFKQFVVKQDKCAMKVSTDAVLLGSWANAQHAKHILDIGTGTGVIAMMLAQKTNASIDAIDIDEGAYLQAKENVVNSKWNERIKVYHASFQEFAQKETKKYDLIVSNPPYFIGSSKAGYFERTLARHADVLPYSDLLDGAVKLLDKKGIFKVILPCKEGEIFRDMAESKRLLLTKLTRVRTKQEKTTEKRLLMQFAFERTSFSENTLVIGHNQDSGYTLEYKQLTKDYYLAF
ncbi:MAG: methyltransferase [Bacteroidetes bacterium]|nr:methyltransferase [Bacteroidota bacterium]